MDAKVIEQAKALLTDMQQAAVDLTEALGLPREATYDILAMMYGGEPSPLGIPQHTVQPAINADAVKTRIFQLSNDFLDARMKGEVATFRAAWEKLKTLPLQTLGQLGRAPAASQGLGFAGGSQQLLPIVSTISWTVINWPSLSQTNPPERITTLIAEEANARGCRLALSFALARYLESHLKNS
jgi:hypothetical protein